MKGLNITDIDRAGKREALILKSRPFFEWSIRLKHLELVKEKMKGLSRCEREKREEKRKKIRGRVLL